MNDFNETFGKLGLILQNATLSDGDVSVEFTIDATKEKMYTAKVVKASTGELYFDIKGRTFSELLEKSEAI